MELREALRMLRSEIGMTQAELAAAVHVGYCAASRWENKNTRPNHASSLGILTLAKERCVSAVCLDALTSILLASRANDKAEKELAEEVTTRMKLERRELLTSEQLKAVIDNLDLAIIGYRIDSADLGGTAIFYHNRRYVEIFGYSEEEFEERSSENMYFGVTQKSRAEYARQLALLLDGAIAITDFVMVLKGRSKNKRVLWLEVKGVSLSRFSFGYELFNSCRDVTDSVEAAHRYAKTEATPSQVVTQRTYGSGRIEAPK